jgi:predicted hotdog family 3-hydroxylacyl-ACP dehydratase
MSAAGRAGFRLLRLDVAAAPAAPAAPPALSAIAQLHVPEAGSSMFAGHFPGRPLLPGIAHLAMLIQVLEGLAARGKLGGDSLVNTAITAVRGFRLRREVVPGDRIELRIQRVVWAGAIDARSRTEGAIDARSRTAGAIGEGDTMHDLGAAGAADPIDAPGAGDAFHFELRRQPAARQPIQPGLPGDIASTGTVLVGTDSAPPPAAAPGQRQRGVPAAGLAPGAVLAQVADLLPHAPPARLLTAVLAAGPGGILCAGSIPAGHPLGGGGEAPGFLAIELGAQAAAALEALARHPGGSPRIGYLVGVRDAQLSVRLPTNRTLQITAVPGGSAGALSTYDMELREEGGGSPLAAGTISTFLPEP